MRVLPEFDVTTIIEARDEFSLCITEIGGQLADSWRRT
jgi:hypothetical protein